MFLKSYARRRALKPMPSYWQSESPHFRKLSKEGNYVRSTKIFRVAPVWLTFYLSMF